jgi:hypothetical protein
MTVNLLSPLLSCVALTVGGSSLDPSFPARYIARPSLETYQYFARNDENRLELKGTYWNLY